MVTSQFDFFQSICKSTLQLYPRIFSRYIIGRSFRKSIDRLRWVTKHCKPNWIRSTAIKTIQQSENQICAYTRQVLELVNNDMPYRPKTIMHFICVIVIEIVSSLRNILIIRST
ncbi:hypothetical protein A462_08607 [Pseudomonas sp. Ag1]|nr:hypothetical protein A462_08607 [Pseudomonas sp. Ag1]